MLFYFSDYLGTGFLYLQYNVDIGIVKALNSSVNTRKINVLMRRFPFPPYERVGTSTISKQGTETLKLLVLLTVVIYGVTIARDVTYDKETGMNVCFYTFILNFMVTCYLRLNVSAIFP